VTFQPFSASPVPVEAVNKRDEPPVVFSLPAIVDQLLDVVVCLEKLSFAGDHHP
jgi:hypothetical protein